MDEMTEKERIDTQLAMLYDLRLQILKDDKKTYTQDDILDLLDTIALEKNTK